ncbi:MAG: CTP:molybdopterin cytidylyltransferase MocA [Candidatus Krumholzibacteriia bacterium]|jgi:CTP:molybdopterin cytidylyltransferase MocA
MISRRDRVIIMARGESSRMGQPKGALSSPGDSGISFLGKIVDLYSRNGLGGIVVTTLELTELYQSLLDTEDGFEVHGFSGGGDTARTLAYGWSALGKSATHVWAHPVDLPMVANTTIVRLKKESLRSPEEILRPCFKDRIGHPVVLPTEGSIGFGESHLWRDGPMRSIIAEAKREGDRGAQRLVPVDDMGVVFDFDEPSDLENHSF